MGWYSYGYGQDFPGAPDISCAPGMTPVVVNGVWTCQQAQISCARGKPVLISGVWRCSEDVEVKDWGSCTYGGYKGTCQATSKQCNGIYRAGLCPGPANVQCCLPTAAVTPKAPAPQPAAPPPAVAPPPKPATAAAGGGGALVLLGIGALLFLFARKKR